MKIIPAPGIILIKRIDTQDDLSLGENKTYINKGEVILIGEPLPTLMNTTIPSPVKEVGAIVWFYGHDLNGPYDNFTENGEKYFVVKFEDIRAWSENG